MSNQAKPFDQGRRSFLGGAVGAASLCLAPGVVLHGVADAAPRGEPVSSKVRWGMLIDTNKCASGCDACVQACNKENGIDLVPKTAHVSPDKATQQRPTWIRKAALKDNLSGRTTHLPLLCQHCEHPPCVDVCPTGASFRRADGIVMVDRHTCIGCRYCMMACPYHARSFIHEDVTNQLSHTPRGKGCVESCNFCVHRLDNGQNSTACQDACSMAGHQAILFGDLNDPNSAISKAIAAQASRQIRADLQLNTSVRYSGV
jgi:molybdopterin-containing oxidoreductase family iron-sulfur binding subunit